MKLLKNPTFLKLLDKQQEVDLVHVKEQQEQHTDIRSSTSGRQSARREGAIQSQSPQASNAASTPIKPAPESQPDTIHLPKGELKL